MMNPNSKHNLSKGNVFGMWIVLDSSSVKTESGHFLYKCKCSGCGTTKKVRANHLVSGTSTCCNSCKGKPGKRIKLINTGQVFASMKEAAESCFISEGAIRYALRKPQHDPRYGVTGGLKFVELKKVDEVKGEAA